MANYANAVLIIRLPQELKDTLDCFASQHKLSSSNIVRAAIMQYLNVKGEYDMNGVLHYVSR